MVDSVTRILNACYRGAALLLAPIIFVIGLIVIPVIHEVLVQIVTDISTTPTLDGTLTWFIHIIALAMLVGLAVFCYFFVQKRGWGLFE